MNDNHDDDYRFPKASDIIVTDEVIAWMKRRDQLLQGVRTINKQLRALREKQMAEQPDHAKYRHLTHKPAPAHTEPHFTGINTSATRIFLCGCGKRFDYVFDMHSHISDFANPEKHYDDGEILNGRRIKRDTTRAGNPIKSARTIKPTTGPKPTATRLATDADIDDLV